MKVAPLAPRSLTLILAIDALVLAIAAALIHTHLLYVTIAATTLHIALALGLVWSITLRTTIMYRQVGMQGVMKGYADTVLTIPDDSRIQPTLCILEYRDNGNIIKFQFQRIDYFFDKQLQEFLPPQYPASLPLDEYKQRFLQGGLTNPLIEEFNNRFGYNEFDIPIPAFAELFKEHAVAPMFVFQVFCVILWMLDEYWYYSLFTLIMFVMFESMLVKRRLQNLERIRSMRAKPQQVLAYRKSSWITVESTQLVPGDIICIESSMNAPCDAILLQGSIVVDESILTGESIPQMKTHIHVDDDKNDLDMLNTHKSNAIFSGTKILMASFTGGGKNFRANFLRKARPSSRGAVACVIRTGFGTTQGDLLRTILYGTERVSVNQMDTLLFIVCLLVFAIAASSYVLYYGLQDPSRSRYKLFLNCVMIITSVVPPELPMELSLAVNTSLSKLIKSKIFCTEPFRIPLAGRTNVCCFDKTGTLTQDDFVFKGLCGLATDEEKSLTDLCDLSSQKASLPVMTYITIGGCNSLVEIDDNLVGDPMEKTSLEAINWSINNGHARGNGIEVNILHRFPFTSTLKRMSCVVSIGRQYYVVSKGAPEIVSQFLRETPQEYDETHQYWSKKGCRVISLCYSEIDENRIRDLKSLKRSDVERDWKFAGFLVFESPLKPHSLETIEHLKSSSHEIIMITGDHLLTACEVSRQLGITEKRILALHEYHGEARWLSINGEAVADFNLDEFMHLSSDYDLSVTGDALEVLQLQYANANKLNLFLSKVKIYARVSPDQKEFILKALKACGCFTMMCGDGTNDVGALKQADAGVALIETHEHPQRQQKQSRNVMPEDPIVELGDACIAAPFASKRSTVACCIDIIRQGRCTLVTTLQMYQILAINCLISAYSMSVLYFEGAKFGDSQATVFGFLVAIAYLFMSQSKALPKLSSKRPLASIFSPFMFLSIVGQFAIHIATLITAASWALPFIADDTESLNPEGDFKPNVYNTVIFLVQLTTTLSTFAANYTGPPFMESLRENSKLYWLLVGGVLMAIVCGMNASYELQEMMELVELPEQLSANFVLLLVGDFVGALIYRRILSAVFDRLD